MYVLQAIVYVFGTIYNTISSMHLTTFNSIDTVLAVNKKWTTEVERTNHKKVIYYYYSPGFFYIIS